MAGLRFGIRLYLARRGAVQLGVGALIGSQIDSHPSRNFEIARSAKQRIHRGQHAGEAVTHNVGRDPCAVLLLQVLVTEVASVAIFAVLVFRVEHKRLAQTVLIADERLKGRRLEQPILRRRYEPADIVGYVDVALSVRALRLNAGTAPSDDYGRPYLGVDPRRYADRSPYWTDFTSFAFDAKP